jgi:hypothetical protein
MSVSTHTRSRVILAGRPSRTSGISQDGVPDQGGARVKDLPVILVSLAMKQKFAIVAVMPPSEESKHLVQDTRGLARPEHRH